MTKHLGVSEEVQLPLEVGELPLQVRLSFHSSFCPAALILHCLRHLLLSHAIFIHPHIGVAFPIDTDQSVNGSIIKGCFL